MQKIEALSAHTQSADIITENLRQLKNIFPEAFGEGGIDFEVLKQLLGAALDEREEKWGLNWHGKRRARQASLTPSTGTLRPCLNESVNWATTRNLVIEGDNLEVLKLLQKSYHAQVKMIYIDPPYNTGNDFIYPDDFSESLSTYLQYTGQVDTEGRKFSTNAEASGRFHSKWLNMMYPRLKLARNLLQEDGVIFVSIADHEMHNLRSIMDEIFGPENFIATVIWHKMDSPKNTAIHFSEDHDYIIVFAKDAGTWRPRGLERTAEMIARYKNPDNDPRGVWLLSDMAARNFYAQGRYPITTPSGKVIPGPPAGSYWRVSREKFDELDRDNRIWWGSGDSRPGIKRFLTEVRQGVVPQTYWSWKDVGSTRNAKQELSQHMGAQSGEDLFITPKPTKLIERMLQLSTSAEDNDIILDFFAGTGTTGHATLLANARDNGNRRFILVQLPEPTGNDKYPTISTITKERLRIAGQKFETNVVATDKQLPLTVDTASALSISLDVGFRVFKLDSSNIREWEPDRDNLQQSLLEAMEHLNANRTEEDILFELLLKLGLDLTIPIEQKNIAGKMVHSIGAGTLLVCLAERVNITEVEPLGLGIVAWYKELTPVGETTCVFLDSAFSDDVVKTNLTTILEQNGLENIRSL